MLGENGGVVFRPPHLGHPLGRGDETVGANGSRWYAGVLHVNPVENAVTTPYVAVLVVKIVLALYMFYVVRFLRPRVYPDSPNAGGSRMGKAKDRLTSTGALLVYGVIILGLSDVLNALFENAARS